MVAHYEDRGRLIDGASVAPVRRGRSGRGRVTHGTGADAYHGQVLVTRPEPPDWSLSARQSVTLRAASNISGSKYGESRR